MKNQVRIGAMLVIAFCVTLIFGIILHLKNHGMIVQPRNVIKIIHWVAGYIMTVLLFVHWSQFGKMLTALKRKFAWFYADTWLLVILFLVTLITGTIKLLSPVKIPHLGLWHYGFGIAMSVTVLIHLIKGVPAWIRMRKTSVSHKARTA